MGSSSGMSIGMRNRCTGMTTSIRISLEDFGFRFRVALTLIAQTLNQGLSVLAVLCRDFGCSRLSGGPLKLIHAR